MPFQCPVPVNSHEAVTLGHGGGGRLTQQLVSRILLPCLDNPYLRGLHDGAVVSFPGAERLAISTDSFVVDPPFFPGGDIGLLAVHGTANDLAMCGARPRFLSMALILEEGFPLAKVAQVAASTREACQALDIAIVTGDTKVVQRGKGDGIFINTTGIGEVVSEGEISPKRIRPGDHVLINGPIAEHGISILSVREGLSFQTELVSDTAGLWPLVESVLRSGGDGIHAMRDATRGGVASVLNEAAEQSQLGIVIEEEAIPLREEVRGACEILGLDPLYVANEGKCLVFASPEAGAAALEAMRRHPLGKDARCIGQVVEDHPGLVRMQTGLGGSRVIDMLSGEQLPRIC